MGFLASGFGNFLGQAGSTLGGNTANALAMGSPGTSAFASLGEGALATGVKAGGDLLSGYGAYQQGMFQAKVAANNAQIAQGNIDASLAAGGTAESESRIATGKLIGKQKANQGASGIDVNVGSPVAVRSATQDVGDFDALAIRYNAARQAYGYGIEKSNALAQSSIDKLAAGNALTKGFFNAETSFMSGSSSLAAKYSQFGTSGAYAPGP